MRRRGEPQRKKMRRESPGEKLEGRNELEEKADKEDEKENTKKMMTQGNKQDDGEGKEEATEQPQGKISMKEQRSIKAERRERWKIKKAVREKNKKERERKQQELKEEMVMKGREKTRKQYTLRIWAIGGGPLGRESKEKENTRDREHRRERKGDVKKGIG